MATDDQGNEIGKLFVGGLHQSTTNESLKNYFSKFGDVVEASVMMDHRTGRSRGFGYVRYIDNEGVQKVMSSKHHLEGKEIDPKPCNVNMKGRLQSRRQLKIFVGGIAPEHNEETLRDFFKQFGNITELTLMKDQSGHRHRERMYDQILSVPGFRDDVNLVIISSSAMRGLLLFQDDLNFMDEPTEITNRGHEIPSNSITRDE